MGQTEATQHLLGRTGKSGHHLCDIPADDAHAESNHKETRSQPSWGPFCKISWPMIFKNVKVTKDKETGNLFQT